VTLPVKHKMPSTPFARENWSPNKRSFNDRNLTREAGKAQVPVSIQLGYPARVWQAGLHV
jgi:hypothetical protein